MRFSWPSVDIGFGMRRTGLCCSDFFGEMYCDDSPVAMPKICVGLCSPQASLGVLTAKAFQFSVRSRSQECFYVL